MSTRGLRRCGKRPSLASPGFLYGSDRRDCELHVRMTLNRVGAAPTMGAENPGIRPYYRHYPSAALKTQSFLQL